MWYRRLAGPTTVTILAGTVVAAATISALAGIADGTRPTFAHCRFPTETIQIGYNRQQLARDDKAECLFEEGQYELDADEPEEAQRIFESWSSSSPIRNTRPRRDATSSGLQRRNRHDPALATHRQIRRRERFEAEASWYVQLKRRPRSRQQRRPENFVRIGAFSSSCSMRPEIACSSLPTARISGQRRVVHCAIRQPGSTGIANVLIEIVGHADDAGNELANLDLSQKPCRGRSGTPDRGRRLSGPLAQCCYGPH